MPKPMAPGWRCLPATCASSGLEVWFDEWEITAGDVLVHKFGHKAFERSRNGVLVVSPTWMSRPIVAEEYAAMWRRAVAGQQRLIPVLYQDAELPPMLASRVWVDFRAADGPAYEAKVADWRGRSRVSARGRHRAVAVHCNRHRHRLSPRGCAFGNPDDLRPASPSWR